MEISFDSAKRDRTLAERGLDFADCALVLDGPEQLTLQDTRKDYGEERFITVGHLHRRLVVIVWTKRGNTRRIISMRHANERERRYYKAQVG